MASVSMYHVMKGSWLMADNTPERKHLFHTTEKSDFIVNMTEKQFQKLGFIYLAAAAVILFVMNIPYYVAKGKTLFVFIPLNELQHMKYVDNSRVSSSCSGYISYLQIALYAVSFIGVLILIISASKKYFKPKENKLFILVVIYLLFVVISTFMAYSLRYAFFGKDYRYNGMLTMFSYAALFVAASQINSRDRRKAYLDIFMTIAVINAVYGILQTVPSLTETLPNFFYDMLYVNGDSSTSYEHFVADGLVETPHALAALMTMAFAVGASGAAYERVKSRKVIYGLCCPVFAAAAFQTCTVAGYIGIPFVLLVLIAVEIIRAIKQVKKKSSACGAGKPFVGILVTCVCTAAVFAVLVSLDRAKLYDDSIIWTDSTSRMFAAFPYAEDAAGWRIYPKLWKECLKMLKSCWVFGAGPDCIGFDYYGSSVLYNSSFGFSTDRSYNTYLDIALSCGIPCLLIVLAIGFVTIRKGIKCAGSFFKAEDSWTAVALLTAVLGYIFQANVNISIITVTPFFFIFAGLLWNRPESSAVSAPDSKSESERGRSAKGKTIKA